jgi:hypothetical protein
MDVAKRLGALPGIAALEGSFDPALAEMVETAGGRVLIGENLLRRRLPRLQPGELR